MKIIVFVFLLLSLLPRVALAQAPTETPTPTPISTPQPATANIALSTGNTAAVDYRFSFGDLIIIGNLIVLNVISLARWIQDVIVAVWSRKDKVLLNDE